MIKLVGVIPWHVRLYLNSVAWFAEAFRLEPDYDKVVDRVFKSIKFKEERE